MDEPGALVLEERDRALLEGAEGEAMQLAMRVVSRAAGIMGAERLIEVSFVHIDACFYNGQAHLDFAQYLVDRGARLAVPTWTNAAPVSLIDSDLRQDEGDASFVANARRLMELYVELGCTPVWTCAPYHLPGGPALGDHIVGSESNAVTYYNSVVGARTNKYGDFLDVCAALVGRVPLAGLHTDAGRRGTLLFRLDGLPDDLTRTDIFPHVLGHLVGRRAGSGVPVIDGLPADTTTDQLRAISAAVASSGGVALFHGVGVTPEAPTLEAAFGGEAPGREIPVTPEMLIEARDSLNRGGGLGGGGGLAMVAVGTPHFSFTEFGDLVGLIDGRRVRDGTLFYVSTSRFVKQLAADEGWIEVLEGAGVRVVVDTCTYFSPAIRGCRGRVMTNSAKWAYYAPGMLDVEVVFGSLGECVESAIEGEVRRDPVLWSPAAWGAGS